MLGDVFYVVLFFVLFICFGRPFGGLDGCCFDVYI